MSAQLPKGLFYLTMKESKKDKRLQSLIYALCAAIESFDVKQWTLAKFLWRIAPKAVRRNNYATFVADVICDALIKQFEGIARVFNENPKITSHRPKYQGEKITHQINPFLHQRWVNLPEQPHCLQVEISEYPFFERDKKYGRAKMLLRVVFQLKDGAPAAFLEGLTADEIKAEIIKPTRILLKQNRVKRKFD